jgi:uroporphyrinogen-III synthase
MLVFFSPSGVKSLFKNFPDFQQNDQIIATFGKTTADAAKEAGLKLNVVAPSQVAPSMTMAIEQFVKETNKRKR